MTPRCRIGRLPEVETLAAHLRNQGFVVVAAGVVADGRTKIYAGARGIGIEALFFSELVGSFFVFRAVSLLRRVGVHMYPASCSLIFAPSPLPCT